MLATNLVPRTFWPEKPEERLGQKFGKIYGTLHDLDNITSWNAPWLIEFHMNFWYAGDVGCMGIAGLLLGALIRIGSIGNHMNGRRFAIAIGVAFPLFHQKSNVSLLASNLLGILLPMTLLFRLSDWLSRTLRPATPSTETGDAT